MTFIKYTLPLTAILCISLLTSCANNDNETGDSCDISGYRTVEIGNQTWMAENLNCDVKGSLCYNNNPVYCNKYGRLYNWNTAMVACPSGWHLPNNAEWDELVDFVGDFSIAGTELKAKSGWKDGGNGQDTYAFSALPGGGNSGDYFSDAGYGGYWWTATEYNSYNANFRGMFHYDGYVRWIDTDKNYLFSVRCVQD